MSSPVSFACIYLGTVRLLQGCPAAPGRQTVGPAGRRGLVRGTDFVAESDIVKQDAKGPVRRKHNETKPDRHQQRPGSGARAARPVLAGPGRSWPVLGEPLRSAE